MALIILDKKEPRDPGIGKRLSMLLPDESVFADDGDPVRDPSADR